MPHMLKHTLLLYTLYVLVKSNENPDANPNLSKDPVNSP